MNPKNSKDAAEGKLKEGLNDIAEERNKGAQQTRKKFYNDRQNLSDEGTRIASYWDQVDDLKDALTQLLG